LLITNELFQLHDTTDGKQPSMAEEMMKRRIRNDAAELLYSLEEQIKNVNLPEDKIKAIELMTKQQM